MGFHLNVLWKSEFGEYTFGTSRSLGVGGANGIFRTLSGYGNVKWRPRLRRFIPEMHDDMCMMSGRRRLVIYAYLAMAEAREIPADEAIQHQRNDGWSLPVEPTFV